MKVYAYLRVSTDKQDFENQKTGVVALAKRHNLTIDEFIVDDGVSGAKDPKKRKLGGLMHKLQRGDILLASEISRLGRELYMIMRILEFLSQNGVHLYTDKDNFQLCDDIQSKVLAFAFGLSAEIERKLISQRTKEALARKRLEGVILGRPKGKKTSVEFLKLNKKADLIKQLREEGVSFQKIGAILKVNKDTVRHYYWTYIEPRLDLSCTMTKLQKLERKIQNQSSQQL